MKSQEIKQANTLFPVTELIKKRWSARSFSNKPISENDLFTILEAASWASSSMNEQPWMYIYATKDDAENFKKFHDCLMLGNQPWTENASVIILSLARKTFAKNHAHNRHYLHDTGAANMNLILQATDLDIYGHIMGGFNMEKTIQTFQLDENLEPVAFIALGYLDEPEKLEEPFLTRELTPRTRKPQSEFVFKNNLYA